MVIPFASAQRRTVRLAGTLLLGTLLASCAQPAAGPRASMSTVAKATRGVRPVQAFIGDEWIGNGISYGPHRDGQHPDGASPSRADLQEDLHLMRPHWRLLRMYSSRGATETVLQIIRDERLGMRVMVGAWIAPEARYADDGTKIEEFPDAVAANQAEVATAIRLANEYPDIVWAVSIGNETQVSWSSHKVRTETLIRHIRAARSATKVPVTTADDFLYWLQPESDALAREVDFLVVHIYAMWRSEQLENAVAYTRQQLANVAAAHPDRLLVLGEAGWATQMHTEGDQAKYIKGRPGEPEQQRFYNEFIAWTTSQRVVNFFFEAFDENWKGGPHPNEVEKHWGLFRADRTPKLALQHES